MKIYRFYLATIATSLICSCSQQEDITSQINDFNGSNQASLKHQLTSFINEAEGLTRSEENLTILSVNTESYCIQDGKAVESSTQTRAQDPNSFTLTTVTFTDGENEGFSILSEDEKIDRIYFLTQKGKLADVDNNEVLAHYISCIPQMAANNMLDPVSTTPEIHPEPMHVKPFVKYEWGQGYPFNILAPPCTMDFCNNDTFKGHMPIGCGTIALGALIATCNSFGMYPDVDLSMLPETNVTMDQNKIEQSSRFFYEICRGCGTTFGCEDHLSENLKGTWFNIYNAVQFLTGLYYDVSYVKYQKLDIARLYTELKCRYPHFMGGAKKDDLIHGHAWLIDGITEVSNGIHLHLKWGQYGIHDGWTVSDYFTPRNSNDSYCENQENIYVLYAPQWYGI